MASRRRTNLGRYTTKARKMRLRRDTETSEHKKKRLENQRQRVAAARAAETEEQTRQRREDNRIRRARYLALKREKMRSEKVKERVAQMIENGSCDSSQGEEKVSLVSLVSVAATMGELGNSGRSRKRSSTGRKGTAASRRRAKLARQKRNNDNNNEQRSITGDPEVFVKGVVKQWLNKVKTQLNVKCSRVTIKTEVIDDEEEPVEVPFPVDEAVVPKTEPVDEEATTIEVGEVIVPDLVPNPEELLLSIRQDGIVAPTMAENSAEGNGPLAMPVEPSVKVEGMEVEQPFPVITGDPIVVDEVKQTVEVSLLNEQLPASSNVS